MEDDDDDAFEKCNLENDNDACDVVITDPVDSSSSDFSGSTNFEEKEETITNLVIKFEENKDDIPFDQVLKTPLIYKNKKGREILEPEGRLKDGISELFHTCFQCLQKVEGMDMNLFRRITANSNAHARSKLVRNKCIGYNWQMITVPEMVNFCGSC